MTAADKKDLKRKEALSRQAKYNALYIQEKIKLCRTRRGKCLKETKKLIMQLEPVTT